MVNLGGKCLSMGSIHTLFLWITEVQEEVGNNGRGGRDRVIANNLLKDQFSHKPECRARMSGRLEALK